VHKGDNKSKIEPFANPRGRIDTKPKIVHNAEPTSNLCTSIAKLQASMDGIIKNQEEMMNKIVKWERSQTHGPVQRAIPEREPIL
jgi:hypothetical protein